MCRTKRRNILPATRGESYSLAQNASSQLFHPFPSDHHVSGVSSTPRVRAAVLRVARYCAPRGGAGAARVQQSSAAAGGPAASRGAGRARLGQDGAHLCVPRAGPPCRVRAGGHQVSAGSARSPAAAGTRRRQADTRTQMRVEWEHRGTGPLSRVMDGGTEDVRNQSIDLGHQL